MGAVEHAITAARFLNSDQHGLIKTIPLHTERMNSGKQLGKIITFKLCTHRRGKEGKKKKTPSLRLLRNNLIVLQIICNTLKRGSFGQ